MIDEEYLKLLNMLTSQYYGEDIEEIKERENNLNENLIDLSSIDLTEEILKNNTNIKIGDFYIISRPYNNEWFNITIYEQIKNNNIKTKLNVCKDSRFKNTYWSKKFNYLNSARVNIETLQDIFKWLRAACKIGAFF